MANNIELSRSWKQSLTTSKMKPFAMQVSLWDLLFFKNSQGQICTRYIQNPSESNWKCKGYELPHSIIVFDEKMYIKPINDIDKVGHRIIKKGYPDNSEAQIIAENLTLFDKWSSLGIDMSLPWFDTRTKPLFLKSSNVTKYVQNSTTTSLSTLLNQLKPDKLKTSDFYYIAQDQSVNNYAAGFKVWDKEAALKPKTSYDFYIRSALKPATMGEPNTWGDYPDPWYIATEDDYSEFWANPQSDKNPGTSGADIILCNKDLSFENRFIIPDSGFSAYNTICLNFNSPRVWKNLLRYYSCQATTIDPTNFISFLNEYTINSIDPVLNYLIEHCYIWVKCAFFADYIDHRDFNQKLNQESQVSHKDMILGKGDFKRYEELYSEGAISIVDKAKNTRPYFPTTTPSKDKLRETLLLESEITNNFQTNVKNLIDNANSPDSKIGALPIEPFEEVGTDTSPNFTTKAVTSEMPSIWFDPESRKTFEDYLDYPVTIGKDGNLITAGRILSPTIDELWHTIKELIAGKKADNANNTSDDFGGYPKNTTPQSTINIDTRFKLPTHKFKNNYEEEKRGDPTNIKIEPDQINPDNIVYRVNSWVNNPDSILYNVIKELNDAANEICSVNPNIVDIVNKIESLPKPTEYLPMATVPSLRELEGLIKGLRWNLVYYIKFMQSNAVYIGSDGKPNSDNNPYNRNAGTAYLLHREKDLNTPNTVYDERINRGIPVPFGKGLNPITSDLYGDNNQNIVPSWTVFMSAAGTWQSVSQAINIRIRDDEIW
jgi:hypothetical protein